MSSPAAAFQLCRVLLIQCSRKPQLSYLAPDDLCIRLSPNSVSDASCSHDTLYLQCFHSNEHTFPLEMAKRKLGTQSSHLSGQHITTLTRMVSVPLPGFPSDGPLLCALEQERRSRLPPKPLSPQHPPLHGGQRLEAALSCPYFLRYPRQHLISRLAGADS